MKKFRLLFAIAFAAFSLSSQAQEVNYDDPQYASWGETTEERKANLLVSSYLKEAIDNRSYNEAAAHLNTLIANAPKGSHNIYAHGIRLYDAKIKNALSMKEKTIYIDSVLLIHDLRLEHFADHPKYGAAAILESKARRFAIYKSKDREGLREVFKAAIEAAGSAIKPDIVTLYFQNICIDYQMDEVFADEVLGEYDRLLPMFDLSDATAVEQKELFESAFGNSGAASCENLEALFSEKMAAAPDDADLLSKAVSLMDRARCSSDFYCDTAEKLYVLRPTSQSAMALASIFQNKADYDKATKYLSDALAAEEDMEARESLLSRIALVKLTAGDIHAALRAANESIATEDGTLEDNGIALFVKAQCYARSISCSEFACLAAYWAAADVMSSAIANLSLDESGAAFLEPAQALLSNYRSAFPSSEECFFNEVGDERSSYVVKHGLAAGVSTTVRYRR